MRSGVIWLLTIGVLQLALLLPVQAQAEGIPAEQWTQQERQFVDSMRTAYQKQGLAFDDDQARLAVAEMRERMEQIGGQMGALQAMQASGTLPQMMGAAAMQLPAQTSRGDVGSAPDEARLAAQIAALDGGGGAVIESRSDGFNVNGRPYIDPEGPIVTYSFDRLTGDIGYLARTPAGYVAKLSRMGSQQPALTIATAQRTDSGWSAYTVTGKNIAGTELSIQPRGIFVTRSDSAFYYEAGRGIVNIAAPNGFAIATMQHGNVGSTGYVLLERQQNSSAMGGLGGVFSAARALGTTVGIGRKEDYALMNISSGKLQPLNVESDGKNVIAMSGCKRVNGLVNKCTQSTSFEALYDGGQRNTLHYYWRINWFNTPAGPLAVSLEDSVRDLYVTDLSSGQRAIAFSRTLGISDYDAVQKPDGSIQISAYWAFSKHEVADALAFLRSAPPIAGNAAGATPISGASVASVPAGAAPP